MRQGKVQVPSAWVITFPVRVGDFQKSKRILLTASLMFLGFKVLDGYANAIGWTNGKTRLLIGQGRREGPAQA